MSPVRRKLVRPGTASRAQTAARWQEAFVDHLKNDCHLAANTVAAYRRDLRRFDEWLAGRGTGTARGTLKPADLNIRDLADYAGWLHARKLAPASIARHLVSLKLYFRYLQGEGVV